MMSRLTYLNHVRHRTQINPCLGALAEYLVEPCRQKSRLHLLELSSSSNIRSKSVEISEDNISQVTRTDPLISSRILLIEDIGQHLICLLGEVFQIDPLFFANHVITNFQDIEKAPLPPSLAMLPCTSAERGYANIHYQQVINLGSSVNPKDTAYASKSDANIPRNVRRLPVLSGRTLGLARCCCSIFAKKVNDVQLCLVLVDPPISHVIGRRKYGLKTAYPASLLHGGIEDFIVSELDVDVSSQMDERVWDSSSLLGCLIHHFEADPSQLNLNSPTILSIAYYPVRIILGEWNLYTHVISRYFKYYEYSMNDIAHRLHNDDIIDLQRWRRRSKQSQHKLIALAGFIEYWLDRESEQKHWKLVTKDIRYMQRQLELYSQSFDQIITVATSTIQILDSRRSIREAIKAKRLTYIALVFVPLSWVASLFSMGGDFLPGKGLFWVYFVVGLPLVAVVLLISAYPRNDTITYLD